MTRVDFEELTKKQIALAFLLVILIISVQILFIRHIRNVRSEIDAAARENQLTERVFRAKTDAVSRYKAGFNIDNASAPAEVESATRFYSILINVLSTTGFEDASVIKVAESKDSVSFKVSGEAGYFSLLELLSSFRQSSHLIRILNLELAGQTDGYVGYSFAVECKISVPEPLKTEKKNN